MKALHEALSGGYYLSSSLLNRGPAYSSIRGVYIQSTRWLYVRLYIWLYIWLSIRLWAQRPCVAIIVITRICRCLCHGFKGLNKASCRASVRRAIVRRAIRRVVRRAVDRDVYRTTVRLYVEPLYVELYAGPYLAAKPFL